METSFDNATTRFAERIAATLGEMTLDEKIDFVSGVDWMYTRGVPRLGIRRVRMANASMGLCEEAIPATAFPASIALAATWDVASARAYGAAVGAEFRAAGIDVVLGPGINLYRTATCGRNFEYLGEDPILAGELAVAYIQSLQAQGVSATVKHFAANNSDWHRSVSDSVIDARTLRELYLATFEMVIKRADVGAVMTSYNLVNGEYTAEHRGLIRGILQDEWGYDSVVMSDWGGTWNADASFDSGLTLEMGGAKVFTRENLSAKVDAGTLDMEELDRKVRTLLGWTFALDERREATAGSGRRRCPAHREVALDVARRGTVLLKNEGSLLPLKKEAGRLSVVGPNACPTPASGGGAALVEAIDPRSILGAVLDQAPDVRISRDEAAVGHSDAVLVCVGLNDKREGEAFDRPFELPWQQVALIRECVAANPNVIVVVNAGGGVAMGDWIDDVSAVLHGWYPGEVGAVAVAEILFGAINPSGKLPMSIERVWRDAPAYGHYLPEGADFYTEPDFTSQCRPVFQVPYAEGVFAGYRHYDRTGKDPLFAFGHGLSYTSFSYADMRFEWTAEGATVFCAVTNTGPVAGEEVVQVYVGDSECSVPRPVRELKGFARVALAPGESRIVRVDLPRRAFMFFDADNAAWKLEPGTFNIEIGASSRDIRLTQQHDYVERGTPPG